MGIGFRELLIILAIALLIFGAKRLRTIGTDLGAAVKGFKKAMDDGDTEESNKQLKAPAAPDADFESTPASKTGSKSTNS
jgi:sec-independent protein translocase protein TatA